MLSPVEIAGFIFGIAGVWLTIKEHWLCFPVGLVNVTISLFLFLDQKLYSDTLQQGVYIILLIYGWYRWKYPVKTERPRVGYANNESRLALAGICLITAAGLGVFFDRFTDAEVPYLDAAATALSFGAQYLIAKKKIENWWLWIIVNIMYIGIYIYKDLYLYSILFLVYLLLAFQGLYSWRKALSHQKPEIVNG